MSPLTLNLSFQTQKIISPLKLQCLTSHLQKPYHFSIVLHQVYSNNVHAIQIYQLPHVNVTLLTSTDASFLQHLFSVFVREFQIDGVVTGCDV